MDISEGGALHKLVSRSISIDLSAQAKPLAIWLLSDLHVGAGGAFDGLLFLRHKKAAQRAKARIFALGDLLECVTADSKVAHLGGVWEQDLTIGQQKDRVIGEFEKFQVDVMVDGNHELRSWRTHGSSPLEDIIRALNVRQKTPCQYMPHGGFITIYVGSQKYVLVAHHGEGAPTQLFPKLQSDFPGAEVYCAGHTHELSVAEAFVHTPEGLKTVHWVRTGAYLKTPAYAARRPSTRGIPPTGSYLLWLHPEKHEIRLESLEDRARRSRQTGG